MVEGFSAQAQQLYTINTPIFALLIIQCKRWWYDISYQLSMQIQKQNLKVIEQKIPRLEYSYIMLLNLPIILSSNSFLFYLLFPYLISP